MKKQLMILAELAKISGLNTSEVNMAIEYIEYREYEVCFNLLVNQMFQYDIEIDADTYVLIVQIATKMRLRPKEYSFMTELIRSETKIPQSVKNQLAKTINSTH